MPHSTQRAGGCPRRVAGQSTLRVRDPIISSHLHFPVPNIVPRTHTLLQFAHLSQAMVKEYTTALRDKTLESAEWQERFVQVLSEVQSLEVSHQRAAMLNSFTVPHSLWRQGGFYGGNGGSRGRAPPPPPFLFALKTNQKPFISRQLTTHTPNNSRLTLYSLMNSLRSNCRLRHRSPCRSD